jgi:hypothetical protein
MMFMMKASVFIQKLLDVAQNYKTLYVMGCVGTPLVGDWVSYYCTNHSYNKKAERTAMIKAAGDQSPPVYGFDCVNLIKAILWGWTGAADKMYGGAKYGTNGVPDVTADGMIAKCTGVTTDFDGIKPGAAVWMTGHIGVYIGGKLVVESTPSSQNKVQITGLGNLSNVPSGYYTRKWTKWGFLPYIEYDEEDIDMTKDELKALIKEVVTEVLNEDNPTYKDLSDVPSWWKEDARKLLSSGVVDGGTPATENATDLNIKAETLKAAIIACRYADTKK